MEILRRARLMQRFSILWTVRKTARLLTLSGHGKMLLFLLALIVAAGGSVFAYTARAQAVGDSWSQVSDMPTPRRFLAAGSMNGKVYAVGGYNDVVGRTPALEAYNPLLDYWQELAPMPRLRNFLATAAIDGKLYAVGGLNTAGAVVDTLEVYDLATNDWDTLAPMPTPRGRVAAAAIGGKLYVVGGTVDLLPDTSFECLTTL